MSWHINGEYFENCNCDILCPCLTLGMQEPGDQERCLVPMICKIHKGAFNDVQLDGLNFILVIDSPAIMSEGNWTVALYIDEKAEPEQRQAIIAILSGEHGGVPEMLSSLIGRNLGVKYVPINYISGGIRHRVEVPGIMEFEVEGITTEHSDKAMEIINVGHPMGTSDPTRAATDIELITATQTAIARASML